MYDYTYKVYVMTSIDGKITAINSSAFLTDTTDWTQIDEGSGDKYHHAQGNYLNKPIIDSHGCYNYNLVDGAVTERTAAEKQADIDNMPPVSKTPEQEIAELKQLVADLASLQLGV